MARKTLKLAELIDKANEMLAMSQPDMVAGRWGIIALLESVLHDADAYAGFRYGPGEYLPAAEQTGTRVLKEHYDDTRRIYSKRHVA